MFIEHYASVCKTEERRTDEVKHQLREYEARFKSNAMANPETDQPFTVRELDNAIQSTGKGKAPGRAGQGTL